MFDIGFSELLLVALVALVVLGPERLPHAARLTGAMLGKLRRSFYELKWQVEQEIEENEYKKRVEEQLKQTEQMLNASITAETITKPLSTTKNTTEHESVEYHSAEVSSIPTDVSSIETTNHPNQPIETIPVHEHEHRPHPPST